MLRETNKLIYDLINLEMSYDRVLKKFFWWILLQKNLSQCQCHIAIITNTYEGVVTYAFEGAVIYVCSVGEISSKFLVTMGLQQGWP